MSSLRLALKQSLEESGLSGTGSDRKDRKKDRRGPGRPRKQPRHPGDPPRKRGRPRKYPVDDEDDGGPMREHQRTDDEDEENFSSENEFSAGEEEEEESSQHNADEENDDHSQEENDHHDESQQERHEAADKIQSHWKRKREKTVSSPEPTEPEPKPQPSVDAEPEPDEEATQPPPLSPKPPASPTNNDDTGVKPEKACDEGAEPVAASTAIAETSAPQEKKFTRDKTKTKSKTVPPPAVEVLEWMRSLSIKRARRNVGPGLRVKVRFATKVKREGKIVRKKKWFGGRISAVSKEGSKIRIKYDDGTSEVTKFPDKDVVVDDASNGQHQVPAEKFIPPGMARGEADEAPVSEDPKGTHEVAAATAGKCSGVASPESKISSHEPEESRSKDGKPEGKTAEKAGCKETEEKASKPQKPDALDPEKPILSPKPKSDENPKPKRKRGRPPKHRPMDASSPCHTPKSPRKGIEKTAELRAALLSKKFAPLPDLGLPLIDSTSETVGRPATLGADGGRTSPGKEQIMRASGEHPKSPQRPSLTIRIPNVKKEDSQSLAASAEIGTVAKQTESEKDGPETRDSAVLKRKRSYDDKEGSATEPAPKKLHIHIATSKAPRRESKDGLTGKHALDDAGKHRSDDAQPIRVTESVDDWAVSNQDEQKNPSSVSPTPQSRAKSPELEVPLSPESPHAKKHKRRSTNGDEAAAMGTPLSPEVAKNKADDDSLLATPLAKESDQLKMSGLISSENSAFEKKDDASPLLVQPVLSETRVAGFKPATPRPRSKQETPIVRSGRRAAQQANERITSRQEATVQEPNTKKKKKRRRDGEEDESENSDGDSQWVQCDACKKWRIIPGNVVASLPKQWYCANNVYDPKRASCDAPEQTAKQVAKEKKRMKKRQQRMLEAAAEGEAKEGMRSDIAKERPRSPRPRSPRIRAQQEQYAPPRARSPVYQSPNSDTGSDTNQKPEKKSSSSVRKKELTMEAMDRKKERLTASGDVLPAIEPVEVKRGRGRPRRTVPKESENPSGNSQHADEGENLEWVQCDKCLKWRKLPPHVSADELPEVWYCSMNTWNPSAANCDTPEDKAEGLQDIGIFGSSGAMGGGKLSYRNLIFGSNGRKQNRPISERSRAAESLFLAPSDDPDAPPAVMYANSSAFTSRSKANQAADENVGMSVFELMSHSKLWAELRGAAQPLNTRSTASIGTLPKKNRAPFYTFDTLPMELRQSMKDLIIDCLSSKALTGEEVLLEVQCRNWENAPEDWAAVRAYCSLNVVVTALCDMVKQGVVDCIQKMGEWDINHWNPRYRLAKFRHSSASDPGDASSVSSDSRRAARSLKIAKPWKQNMV